MSIDNNNSVALQKYAIDCINSGLLSNAIAAISSSINELPSSDKDEVDRIVIGLLEKDQA